MTPAGLRPIALRSVAVAIPVAVACWGWLTLLRLAGALQKVGTAGWDVWAALALGAGSALVHGGAIWLARLRPERAVSLVVLSLPLVVVVSVAQATYATGIMDDGVGGGFSGLAALGRRLVASPGESLGLCLGLSVGFAVPLAYDARWRVFDERASPGRALATVLGALGALLVAAVLARLVAGTPIGKVTILSAGLGVGSLFLVGLPLTLLLAWASLYEDHLRGWKRPVYRPG